MHSEVDFYYAHHKSLKSIRKIFKQKSPTFFIGYTDFYFLPNLNATNNENQNSYQKIEKMMTLEI